MSQVTDARTVIEEGAAVLGIELGSTRIKAVLVGPDHAPLATGGYDWENQLVDGRWTYDLDTVWSGLQTAYAEVAEDVRSRYEVELTELGGLGVSAMMHGYLAFDADGELLTPFRTWRNTDTARAAAALTAEFGFNIPHRWSIAHFRQAQLDGEEHVGRVAFLTTLAGYVHWQLTDEQVLGVGDASGMFPIDGATVDFDADMIQRFDALAGGTGSIGSIRQVLPRVLGAGAEAGRLSEQGAVRLDATGRLRPGVLLAPPEGDAGTGMVATNAVAPRTGNVSAGTSIFAMVVLENPLRMVHSELDIVTTPAGDPVAMVHCNNGASELNAWAGVFGQFAAGMGYPVPADTVFETMFRAALDAPADGGGLVAYNYLSGEPITGLEQGRPLIVRMPSGELNLGTFVRTQLYAAFATLQVGMEVLLRDEEVAVGTLFAHGGLFKTEGVAQRMLAAALGIPVSVGEVAGEGGAWGAAVLAAYARYREPDQSLADYLTDRVFEGAQLVTIEPDATEVAGFATFMQRWRAGLDVERAAVEHLG